MNHTEKSEQEFEEWCQHTGDKIMLQARFCPSLAVLKAVCRIAYFQGRIDENTKTAEQVGQMLDQRAP